MPRPKVPGAPEPKRRSRTGCWTCKAKKVKCGEEKPRCLNCDRNGEQVCDYSIRLNWEGRSKRKGKSTPEPGENVARDSSVPKSLPTAMSFQNKGQVSPALGSPSMIDPALILFKLPMVGSNPQQQQQQHRQSVPNPEDYSSYGSPGASSNDVGTPDFQDEQRQFRPAEMPPPFHTDYFAKGRTGVINFQGSAMSSVHRPKRSRHSSASDVIPRSGTPERRPPRSHHHSIPNTSNPYFSSAMRSTPANGNHVAYFDSYSSNGGLPLTPSDSSVNSEDFHAVPSVRSSPMLHPSLDESRRMSVNSVLIREEATARNRTTGFGGDGMDDSSEYVSFGIDRGLPDLDVPNNDDAHVLDMVTPVLTNADFADRINDQSTEFGFGLYTGNAPSKIASYADPLPVKIRRSLEPLPKLLFDNPMNMMYFHFFIEFTARILVPHDCPANPFKVILPQMAVRDDNLLQLMLAYSASHRARLLRHPEPTHRIAVWVRDVFPNLRRTLEDPSIQITNTNVATAVMLASLEIVAPNTFGVEVPWQDHLSMARRMIYARGETRASDGSRDRVSHFLIRWFAYLDVLGNFSSTGVRSDQAMFRGGLYDFGKENDFQIDCLLGFSGFLAGILVRIADLTRQCDSERLLENGEVDYEWQPSPDVVYQAEDIKADLEAARLQRYSLCPHRQSTTEMETAWESVEMAATNEAFHWAGVVHLNRRVFGLPQDNEAVQHAVREVIGTIHKVRKGGSAEACLIFPLVTAGCEAMEDSQREIILERIKSVEESGMTQVHKARKLLELVWETGRPWETLVRGEFFG